MANEIGMELENQNPPAEDRSQGGFSKFFHDPKNIATALIFGASLLQPRQPGNNAVQTFAQRAVGAAAFRGALESGVQQQKLKREQTAFERAQIAKENAQRERQISVSEEGVDVQREQLQQQDEQFDERMGFESEQARLNRELELQLANIKNAPTEADLIGIAMQTVPYLLETMQFDEGLSTGQKIQIAQNEAIKGVLQTRAILQSGGKVVVGPDGRTYVDDGKGGNMTPWITPTQGAPQPNATTPAAAPAPAAPPQESAETRATRIASEQERSTFAPTFGERRQRRAAENEVINERFARRQAMAMLRGRALGFQRLLELNQRPTAQHVRELAFFTDQELAEMGLRPQVIIGLRQMQQQLPAQ